MTLEEAINRIEDHMEVHHIGEYPHIKLKEALDMALTALRPVSREQVEKVWRGEWREDEFLYRYCSLCDFEFDEPTKSTNFCPHCGAPMTDEAVEMVMERMEEMKNG